MRFQASARFARATYSLGVPNFLFLVVGCPEFFAVLLATLQTDTRSPRMQVVAGVCLTLALGLFVFTSAVAERRKATPVSVPARLSARAPHVVRTVRGGISEVRLLTVEISNVGSGIADGVMVRAKFADGTVIPLRGPRRMPPRSTAVFSSTGRQLVMSSRIPDVYTECGTCR